jgi:hypothetical protein
MGLCSEISGDRGLSDNCEQAADFSHYVKRDQEVREKRAYSVFSTNRFVCGLATYFNIVRVIGVEYREIVFESFADLGARDCCVKDAFA